MQNPQVVGDPFELAAVVGDLPEDPTEGADLGQGARDKADPIRSDELLLSELQSAPQAAVGVHDDPAEPEGGARAHRVAQLPQPALAREDLLGELPAELSRHHALEALDHRGDGTGTVDEGLGAVLDSDAGAA